MMDWVWAVCLVLASMGLVVFLVGAATTQAGRVKRRDQRFQVELDSAWDPKDESDIP